MKIQLKESQVLNLVVKECFDEAGNSMEIEMSCLPNRNNDTEFSIIFSLEIVMPQQFYLDITFKANFTTQIGDSLEEPLPLEENFQNHPFINVNAPAIAYPFLRTTVATILLNCGYNPIMLPAVNFQAKYNEQKSSNLDK